MRKIIVSMALLLSVGTIMGQQDKAALKQAQKEAKAQMAEAQKIYDAINAKITEKTATDDEIITECKKGQAYIRKAIKSGAIAENKLGEAYKLSADLSLQPHNIMLNHAVNKEPFDTAYFYSNLKAMTDALQGEVKNTKVTRGETGNETYIKGRTNNLAQCGDYYVYAAQFNNDCKQYDKALESYEIAMNYAKKYPEVASIVQLRIPDEQIAYFAFITSFESEKYDKMDTYYDLAVQFKEGAIGVKQRKAVSYIQRGDSIGWANYVREMTVKEPTGNDDFISTLITYYLRKDREAGAEGNQTIGYVDEVIAADPSCLIAHYGKAASYFDKKRYDEAFAEYLKCTELKSDYFDAWYQCGLSKYRQGYDLNEKIETVKGEAEKKATKEKAKVFFGETIPYFEKALDLAPDEIRKRQCATLLYDCYIATEQKDKAAKLDKLL